jgi:hypothetical protein
MQETHDEGNERSAATEAGGAYRLDEDSHEVKIELLGAGWAGPIGHAHDFNLQIPLRFKSKGRHIVWEKLSIKEFFFAPAAAILVAQGRPIQDFFPPDVMFAFIPKARILACGPYFFLKGRLTGPTHPPLRLIDLVLGCVVKCPEDMPMEELRGLLLEQVM